MAFTEERQPALSPTTLFSEGFALSNANRSTSGTVAWGVNPNDGTGHTTTLRLTGNATDWTVQAYRNGNVGDTQQARVAFKLSQTGSGAVVGRERYSAFGERRRGETPPTTDRLYTGQQYNSLSGLYHYSDGTSAGRFYDPLLARFVMADSVAPGTGSQALNRYSLNFGNPLKYTDPNGKFPVLIAAGAVVGGAVAYGLQVNANFQRDPSMSWQAALTTNISGAEIATGAVIGATAIIAAPAAVALVGEELMGVGIAAGSTSVFAAGTATTDIAGNLGYAVLGGVTAGGLQGVISRGFKGDAALYDEFKATLEEGLPEGTKAYLRGSVVTNRSWKAGLPFDAQGYASSDLDVALVGQGTMDEWETFAVYPGRFNTWPLSDQSVEIAPGLNGLRTSLQTMVGRPVNFQATTDWYLWTRQNVFGQPNIRILPD